MTTWVRNLITPNIEHLPIRSLDSAMILIVDDQPINLEILSNHLKDKYRIFTVNSGQLALEFCHRHMPDLIIMDVQMPDMDGLTACKIIKSSSELSSIPVLFATCLSSASNQTDCWEAGGNDFIVKPITPETLINRVKAHLCFKFQTDLLKELAFLDGLTGLYNRRFFDDYIRQQMGFANRNRKPLSILLLDLDFFKGYNDHFGHLKGDDCLKAIANEVRKSVNRPTDVVARFGGEEFICVLPGADLQGAKLVANKIIKAIAGLKIPHPESPHQYCSVSIGISVASTENDSPCKLIEFADKLLYKAKQRGRNCVEHD